jgi:hypothetical protein
MDSMIDGSIAVSGVLAGLLMAVSALVASAPRPAVILARPVTEQKKAA